MGKMHITTNKLKRIYVNVIPRASRNKIEKISEGEYKVWITAPPIAGQANKKLVEIMAEYMKVSKSQVNIIGGRSAKIKIIDIAD